MLVPITVREVMRGVRTVAPDASGTRVASILHDTDSDALVVVDAGEPVGIVTETDVVRLVAVGGTEASAGDFMSSPLVTIGPDEPIEAAVERMEDDDIENLPVVEDGALIGLVDAGDLSEYLPRALAAAPRERPRRRVRTDTAYEDDAWAFEFRGASEAAVAVGDVARFSKPISQADVEAFADATGDTNRLHLDDDYARRTRFGERIAHGVLTTGLISAALARLPGLVIYLSQNVGFHGPVPVGDRAEAVCEVVEDLGGRKYALRTEVYDGDSERVLDGTARVLVDEVPGEDDSGSGQREEREVVAPGGEGGE